MAPPAPIPCTKADCTWTTPAGCPTWEALLKFVELHTSAEHGSPVAPASQSQTSHLEKLPRPSFKLDMSEAEWAFKESQWQAYISQSPVSETVKVHQLKAACDESLLQRVYDAGGYENLTTEQLLLSQMKKLGS